MLGTKIANSWADLTDGSIEVPINASEFGTSIADASVWTGTTAAGAYSGDSCGNWLDESLSALGDTGESDSYTGGWTSRGGSRCNEPRHLYCFEQPWCGNGVVDLASEQCDDGNTSDTDGCTNSCLVVNQTAGGTPTEEPVVKEPGLTVPTIRKSPAIEVEQSSPSLNLQSSQLAE